VISPGYNGSVCQQLTLSCLLSLVVEHLERYVIYVVVRGIRHEAIAAHDRIMCMRYTEHH